MQRKTCKANGCYLPIWAKGYCPRHQKLRPDYKPPKLKSTAKLKSKKRLTAKKGFSKKRKVTGELDLFHVIWETRSHESFIESGANLEQYAGTDLFVNMFAHVLSKKDYPHLRLEPFNIVLLAPIEHEMFDAGTEDQRVNYSLLTGAKWDKLYGLKEQLRQREIEKNSIPKFE